MKNIFGVLFLGPLFSILIFSTQTIAQSGSSIVSAVDQDLTIKTVTSIPFTDNINGIYAAPLFKNFQKMLNDERLWSYEALPESSLIPPDSDENPEAIRSFLALTKSQGLFSFHLTKGPRGINARLIFFVGQSGTPLLQEELTNYQKFDTADLTKQLEKMYEKIKARLPYRGMILSRRGQEVTINLGYKHGLKNNDEIAVIQFLKLSRHPKLKFLVGSEKEILGKIKVFKADESLSFAFVTYEREPGTIQATAKLLPSEFVQYNEPITREGQVIPGLENRPDRELSYGDQPKEWLPVLAPQYGRVAILAGFGNYGISTNLATGTIDSSTAMAPEIAVKGELWLSSEWNILYSLRQSVFNVSNSLVGATPGRLNMSLSSYSVLGAYNFLMTEDFFGPKIQLSGGYSTYNSHSDQSTPLAFTNMNYSGLMVGFLGQFPLGQELPLDLGAQFNFFISPGISESVASGDSSKSTINQFGFFGVYHLNSRLKIRGEFNFEYYATDFSGAGAGTHTSTNTTQKLTSLLGGIEYLF